MSSKFDLRNLSRFEWILIASVGVWAVWFQVHLPSRLPSDEDYRRLAVELKAEIKAGDVVLLEPWWTEKARLFLSSFAVVTGYWGSDRDDLVQFSRIWKVEQPNLPGNPTKAFDSAFLPERVQQGPPRKLGALELTLFLNGRHRPFFFSASKSLSDRFHTAYIEAGEKGGRHRIPIAVATEWHEIAYAPHRCIFLRPPGGKARAVVEFPEVPPGSTWRLEAGYVWNRGSIVVSPSGFPLTPVELGADDAVTGETLMRLNLPVGVQGNQHAERVPPRLSSKGINLWIKSENPESRETCVDFWVEAR